MENNEEKKAPEVQFTFFDDELTEEEQRAKLEEIIRKRNEFFLSQGWEIPNPDFAETETENLDDSSPRRGR